MGTASALVVGFSGLAYADDTRVTLNHGGHRMGYMEHEDEEPDSFRVCDTYANGHGVTGGLYIWVNFYNQWQLLEEVSDGGDEGCGKFTNDLSNSLYQMRIEGHGGTGIELKNLRE
ncbi:hypothetical protein JQK87_26040 [Streptomyces sp. G44]|uniref:hypothetical protein n=1 Tax=Streptomyces sp. G44 TaxID=2807632 RepID=UPI00195FEC20|nr:hypothetical protein [Streptomyces sp. G44]MBM7171801.1 hypothetical protein [Streptomyces sp. G44]